jgi:glucose-1-phosphate adenylyltransferase
MSRQTHNRLDALAVVLAGGHGTRLRGLTRDQCKPALPFAGHFRNIDFALSNCVNSQIRRIGVLTQYKAQTLIGHIASGWNFLPRHLGEFVDVWPAQQRLHSGWYGGTADAVRQNLDLILAQDTRYTLVLASDHIYKMDFRPLLDQHARSRANVTIACLPVAIEQASSFGVLGVDSAGAVRSFREKPAPSALDAPGGTVLASMGIYVFDTDYLAMRLERDERAAGSTHDFGRDLLPVAVREDRVGAFVFADPAGKPGYWRDVGTLEAYWQAHMELLADEPALDLYDPDWPIWTMPEQLPPARLIYDDSHHGYVANSMVSAGTVIRGAVITNSVIGSSARVDRDTLLDESVVLPGARIGADCSLRRTIIDSGTVIPDGTVVCPRGTSSDAITLLTRDSMATSCLPVLEPTRHERPRAASAAIAGSPTAMRRSRPPLRASS